MSEGGVTSAAASYRDVYKCCSATRENRNVGMAAAAYQAA